MREQIISLPQWFQETLPLIRSAVGAETKVQVCVSDKIWALSVDHADFAAAIINIAVNARDAMPSGGVFVAKAENVTYHGPMPNLSAGEYVSLQLTDTGTDMQHACFNPCFRTTFDDKGARFRYWPGLGPGTRYDRAG